jgi:hypothetical protein
MKPIPKNIGHTSQWIHVGSYLDDWPYRSGKAALKEQVFNRFIVMTEYTQSTPMPIPLNKIVFG